MSQVLKIKSNGDKVWIRLESGPGQVIGEGAVKPAGKPETAINVPFTTREARKSGSAALGFIQAWETTRLVLGPEISANTESANHVPPDERELPEYDMPPDGF